MSDILAQHTIEQDWSGYTEEEHAVWRYLFERQQRLLAGHGLVLDRHQIVASIIARNSAVASGITPNQA